MTIFNKQIAYCHHHDRHQLTSPDCVTIVSGRNSQQKRTQAFTRISRHENLIVHTNIKVVNWVTNYKEYK